MENKVQLITYVDRLGKDIKGLTVLLTNEFSGLFGGVHLLPFFTPMDGEDAGFDPTDHTCVDSKLGDWSDVRALTNVMPVMADVIVNHMSSGSKQFLDVVENGKASAYWELFLKRDDVFDAKSPDCLEKIIRPRPTPPFTTVTLADGTQVEFWTTFGPRQIDINVESEAGRGYLDRIYQTFADSGIKYLRLDAIGYAVKRSGTSCFMVPETFDFISALADKAEQSGMETLVEVHSHYKKQLDIAKQVSWVYDFALPPLILHAFYRRDCSPLGRWLQNSPRNCLTVLDTHDGIGIVDVAGNKRHPGFLDDEQINFLVEEIHRQTKGESVEASGHAASNLDIYQVNATYYDALGRSDRKYLLARAIQLFAPGVPQIYYMGLLAQPNDMELLKSTGVGRDINRHYFSSEDIEAAIERPVVQSLFKLIRLRNTALGFKGEFSMHQRSYSHIKLCWVHGQDTIELDIDMSEFEGHITQCEGGNAQHFSIADQLKENV